MVRGGAWGLFQVTLATAKDLFTRFPQLRTLRAWDGTGRGLLDPELNTMLASFYLGQIWKEFGSFVPAIAAYHQGPATVRKIIAAGGDVATKIGPKGRAYLATAQQEKQRFVDRGLA